MFCFGRASPVFVYFIICFYLKHELDDLDFDVADMWIDHYIQNDFDQTLLEFIIDSIDDLMEDLDCTEQHPKVIWISSDQQTH